MTVKPVSEHHGLSRRPPDGQNPKTMRVKLGRLLDMTLSRKKFFALTGEGAVSNPQAEVRPDNQSPNAALPQSSSHLPANLPHECDDTSPELAPGNNAAADVRKELPDANLLSSAPIAVMPLTAKVGFEIEIPSVHVVPSVPRGTVLLQGSGWRLETDLLPLTMEADLEFVLSPMSSPADIEKAVSEIIGFVEGLRAAAINAEEQKVPLSAVADTNQSYTLEVKDLLFPARLQATYGVGMDKISESIDKYFLKGHAKNIHEATDKVAAFYKKASGADLTDNAKGFVELINMYLERAVGGTSSGTVHICFRMMARSDFCSMFDKLLDPDSQTQIRNLLIPAEPSDPSDIPLFMKALGLDVDATVFKEPYKDYNFVEDFKGPTIKEWFASIIHGRGEGLLKKDLMSPPPGYHLHTGNFDADYGMGAMSVDKDNGLALFEIRGAPHRPDSIPMNKQILNAVLREYSDAQECNPKLEKLSQPFEMLAPNYKIIAEYEKARNALKSLGEKLSKLSDGARTWRSIKSQIKLCKKDLPQGTNMSSVDQSSWIKSAQDHIDELATMLEKFQNFPFPLENAHDIAGDLPLFKQKLKALDQILWEAGS